MSWEPLRRGWVSSTDAAWPWRSRRCRPPTAHGKRWSSLRAAGIVTGVLSRTARPRTIERTLARQGLADVDRSRPIRSTRSARYKPYPRVYALAVPRRRCPSSADRLRDGEWLGCRRRRRVSGLPRRRGCPYPSGGPARADAGGRRAALDRDAWPGCPPSSWIDRPDGLSRAPAPTARARLPFGAMPRLAVTSHRP